MRIFKSLQSLLTFSFVLAAVLPILIIGIIAIRSLSISMEKEITNKNFLLAKTIAGETERFLREPMNFLKQIEEIIRKQNLVQPERINDYLSSVISIYGFFDTIMILDHRGRIKLLAPYRDDFIGIDMSGHRFFKNANELRDPCRSQMFISMRTGHPTLPLSLPLEDGMLVGYVNLTVLNSITDKIKIDSQGYAAIYDHDGTAIAHPDRRFVSERVNLKNMDLFNHGFSGKEGSFRYDFMGEDVLASIAFVAETDWIVGVIQPAEEAFAPVEKIRNIVWAGTVFAIIFAAMTALFGLKKTMNPILQLTEKTRRIAGGDYSYHLQPAGYREIDNLQNQFMIMTHAVKTREDALHKAQEKLEQRVEERTFQLKKAKEAAEVANRTKSIFLANMSHEIRTPMNAILGFAEILTTRIEDPQHLEFLSSIESSGKGLMTLVNDILDLSKVEAGKMKIEYESVNVRSVFREVERIFSRAVKEKGLKLIFEPGSCLPEYLVLDEIRLRQILFNLVGNAVRYTDKGHIRIRVGIYSSDGSEHPAGTDLIFSVEDTGIGIPEAEREVIFQAFEQLENRGNYRHGGTGLGLSISKRLTEMMGGTISVSGVEGGGSLFTVKIPGILKTDPAGAQKQKNTKPDFSDHIHFSKVSILIADDEPDNRKVIKGYLEMYDFTFLEAENGEQALELAKTHQPDLILMDMKMPVVSGKEAVHILKSDIGTADIPIIAITAMVLTEDRNEIETLCDGYLSKPVSRIAIINELKRFLKYSNYEKDSEKPNDNESESDNRFSGHHDPEKLSALIRRLESRMEKCKYLIRTLPMNEIRDFGVEMQALATEFACRDLAAWGVTIQHQAECFAIEDLRKSLKQFPAITAKMKIAISGRE